MYQKLSFMNEELSTKITQELKQCAEYLYKENKKLMKKRRKSS
jgi:hypothetical protein